MVILTMGGTHAIQSVTTLPPCGRLMVVWGSELMLNES